MYNAKNGVLLLSQRNSKGGTVMEHTTLGTAAASSNGEKWYYMAGGKKIGPVDVSNVIAMLESGEMTRDTRVWTKGMEKWTPVSETNLMNRINESRQGPVVINLNKTQESENKRKTRWWIWIIVGVIVISILGAAAFFLLRPKAASEAPLEETITYNMSKTVIFENDACAFIIDDIGEKGDYLELDVRCVNKTSDLLSFAWNATCINGSMFDPLWHVYVQGNSTMTSSITFPLNTLESYNLLPAEQIKFVLSVFNENQFQKQKEESAEYVVSEGEWLSEEALKDYKQITGYEGYLFKKNVKTDEDGRPYYISKGKTIYFDEIYNSNGQPLYQGGSGISNYQSFYNDSFGRPYYFSDYGTTIYYDGYGFAFYDDAEQKHYYYTENGDYAYYGNGGIPEYYKGKVSQELLDEGKPKRLARADGNYLVHKEFAIYPTGKNADKIVYPNRVSASTEQIYWNGEKGKFIVLGGTKDEFKGYIVHTYIENSSDSYVYFGWEGVIVNGVLTFPDSVTALRPHSSAYRNVIISADVLDDNKIKTVEEIDFRVYAVGENLSIPLYPIAWEAKSISNLSK